MVKIVQSLIITMAILQADNLEKACLSCHKVQKIPSDLIYRRYLLRHSSTAKIEEAILSYIQDPKKENSIMPIQFFMKFSIKKAMHDESSSLRQEVKAFIQTFDLKKKLILEKNSY